MRVCRVYRAIFFFFFFNDTATTEIYTLSLHDALPISPGRHGDRRAHAEQDGRATAATLRVDCPLLAHRRIRRSCSARSEEHTSELQSPCNLVCRLLLEKKTRIAYTHSDTPM